MVGDPLSSCASPAFTKVLDAAVFSPPASSTGVSPDESLRYLRHVAIVLRQRLAEKMAARVVGHEIHIVGDRRRQRRAQRSLARIRDRSGRQAGIPVRIVSRIHLQIFGVHHFHRMALQLQSVSHRRIALQRSAMLEPVVKNSGDQRTFVAARRFSLHQRRQRHHLIRRKPLRKRVRVRSIQRFPHRAEILHHPFHHLLAGRVVRELICRRK